MAAPKADSRKRAWFITWNNPPENYMDYINAQPKTKYLVYADEFASTGTYHVHIYPEYVNSRTFTAVKKSFPGANVKFRRGTPTECSEYIKKTGEYQELGELPLSSEEIGEQEAARWKRIRRSIIDGSFDDIDDQYVCLHARNIPSIRALHDNSRPVENRNVLYNFWIWGASGTGKSRGVRAWCTENNIPLYEKQPDQWWCNYRGEEAVIIDDFDRDDSKKNIKLLKQMADHYPFRGQVKGGTIDHIRPQYVFITSNYNLEELWQASQDLGPMLRRFTVFEKTHTNKLPFFDYPPPLPLRRHQPPPEHGVS